MNAKTALEKQVGSNITHLPHTDIALSVTDGTLHAAFPQRSLVIPARNTFVLQARNLQFHYLSEKLEYTELFLVVEKGFLKTKKMLMFRLKHPVIGTSDKVVDSNLAESEINQLSDFCKTNAVAVFTMHIKT